MKIHIKNPFHWLVAGIIFILGLFAAQRPWTKWHEGVNLKGMTMSQYLVTSRRRYAPADEKSIAAFESFLGERLPSLYRDFLAEVNGGQFESCAIDFTGVLPTGRRPVPKVQILQNLRTLSLPPSSPSSLYHEPDFMGVLRQDDDVLLQVGQTEDSNLIYLALTTERRGQVWFKTSILPVFEDGALKDYDSEWFFLADDFDGFLARLYKYGQ